MDMDGSNLKRLTEGKTDLFPAISPDGRWVAYQSFESGSSEIYVQPFPGPGAKVRISTQSGAFPRW